MEQNMDNKQHNTDRRIVKTKKALINSLATLLCKKELSAITVTKLVELSDVNRKTFYAHYPNVSDLYNDLKSEIMQTFEDICSTLDFTTGGYGIEPALEKMMNLLGDDKELYHYIFTAPGYRDILKEAIDMLKESFINETSKYYSINELILQYVATFISTGIFDTIHQWIDADEPMPSKTLALALSDFISAGMGLLLSTYK